MRLTIALVSGGMGQGGCGLRHIVHLQQLMHKQKVLRQLPTETIKL